MGKKKILGLFYTVCVVMSLNLVLVEAASSQSPQSNIYSYAKKEENLDAIPYWRDNIQLQMLTLENNSDVSNVANYVFSSINQYSYLAKANFVSIGQSDGQSMIQQQEDVDAEANFLVGLVDNIGRLIDQNGTPALPFDFSQNEIGEIIIESGLEVVGDGCLGRWLVNEANQIEGFLLMIDSALPETEQIYCANYLLPFAFGIQPGGLNLPMLDPKSGEENYSVFDDSSISMRLNAATACRVYENDRTERCAAKILDSFYSTYGSLTIRGEN